MINLLEFPAHLKTLSKNDWEKLFDILPELEKPQLFGQLKGMVKSEDGTISMPYWDWSKIISDFLRIINELNLVIDFDWGSWEEGKAILKKEKQDFGSLDAVTLCKLMTAIIRSDRFMDGALISRFEDGTMQKIIKALKSNYSMIPEEPKIYIPKVGDQIYIDSAFYLTHGEDDFVGGLCTITYVEGDEPPFWIQIAEDRGKFTWSYIEEEQEMLKKKFGTSRGHRRPDDREEFNRL